MKEHLAVWLDHQEARVFLFHSDKVDEMTVTAPQHLHHRHPKGPEGGKEHPDDVKRFFHEVARLLAGDQTVLVVGPSTAKVEFLKYVQEHDSSLGKRIVGVETVDHPTDGQLVAYAKKYFERVDRMG